MTLGPRAKLGVLALLFLAPIAASFTAYYLVRPAATSNYGELLSPPARMPAQAFARAGGGRFTFAQLEGQWALVAAQPGPCDEACVRKLSAMRQVRLSLGRRASRVGRVLVTHAASPALAPFEDMTIVVPLAGEPPPGGALGDAAHIYLVDPHGNVMMRWPAEPDPKRMLRDLDRLLRASQIG